VLTCTKIYEADLADQVLDSEKCPEWQAECTKLVYAFPTNEKLWQQYAEVRAESLRMGNGGREATEFYRKHRVEMDAGAAVAWPERFDAKKEISALQHAMNLKMRDEEAFFAEYQNEPMQEQLHDEILTPEMVCEKINGRSRGEVPLACTRITMFVDVHDRLLYWCVCGWEEDFTGYVLDYGTFPDQRRPFFTMADSLRTLGRTFPGIGTDAAIQAGLERLVVQHLERDWTRTGGGLMKIDRLLVDSGFKPGIVEAVKHKVGGSAMMLSKGVGIRAGRKPMSTYARRPGEVHGHFWYVPNVAKTAEFPHVQVDVNYWKMFIHAGLATAAGDRGSISVFGKKPRDHELFAEQVAHAETWVETQGHGRVVHEWSLRPARPDNHWFDCIVGCAAAASMCGVKVPGQDTKPARQRKRYSQQDLQRK
jgi:phage terminase large subunit GpA-like protein